MKNIIALTLIGCLFIVNNPLKAGDTTKVTNIGFTKWIKAKDFQIRNLTAMLVGDSVLFTVTYKSKKDRYLSFFNPPSGSVYMYANMNGIKKDDTIATFYVKKDILNSLDRITMRFSITNMFKRDRNFISLDRITVNGNTIKTPSPFLLSLYQHHRDITSFKAYQDVRWDNLSPIENTLTYERIATLIYNKNSNFGKHKTDAEQIMEKGKNPGLGVRLLHEKGITGKNIRVAVISQNLPGNHPEYKDQILKYKDFGCRQPKNKGSMMGPGLLSSLVGKNTGTAPDALVYFAAIPEWKMDGKYYANALKWIIEENKKLMPDNKIKIVTTNVIGTIKTNNNEWVDAVKLAETEGIVILDCTEERGLCGPCYYDINSPEEAGKCIAGWPDMNTNLKFPLYKIYMPCSGRTFAEEYKRGENSYQYYGKARNMWSSTYLAGVIAMGWQINPNIKGSEMIKILINTATANSQGYKIINPLEFINKLQEMK